MNKEHVVQSLLDKTYYIKNGRQQLQSKTGEEFNLFSVLHLEYSEARLHSRLLAELLKPKGQHGQGTKFLELFLQQVNLASIDRELISSTKVYTEEYVGPISADCMKGGLIDIVIKIPHDQVIVIENKINTGDQKHQLIRYRNAYPNANLLYLTKDGKMPSEYSTCDQATKQLIVDFKGDPKNICISYDKQILGWLEACYQASLRLPLIRETLHQYINTIKSITNHSTDNTMSNEIADAITSSNSGLEAFFTLRKQEVVKDVERKLLYKFIDETTAYANELGLIYDEKNNYHEFGHSEKETEISFLVPGTPLSIAFGFDTWRVDFSIGISFNGSRDEELAKELSARLTAALGKDANYPNWYYILYLNDSKHGDEYLARWEEGKFSVWGGIQDGSVSKKIKWYFGTLLKELNELKLVNTGKVNNGVMSNTGI